MNANIVWIYKIIHDEVPQQIEDELETLTLALWHYRLASMGMFGLARI